MSPDDECLVCGTKRDEHGDKHHEFSLTSDVPVPKKKPEPGKEPPKERQPQTLAEANRRIDELTLRLKDTREAFIRFLELQVERKVIDAKDILKVLGG